MSCYVYIMHENVVHGVLYVLPGDPERYELQLYKVYSLKSVKMY